MIMPLLITLSLASFALMVGSIATEEIECLTARLLALLLLLCSLYFAPLTLKLLMLMLLSWSHRHLYHSAFSDKITH
ncbi:MAG: hypothetical protein AB4041_09660 [Microcystaceae cyanobacterium]